MPVRGEKESHWVPMSRFSARTWAFFYLLFLIYAFSMRGLFLLIDLVNLVVHEGGHLLFGWFGVTIGIWGGTILQWSVPLLLAAYFYTQRQLAAFTFSAFFFFENLLYTATYMCDARAMALPLVSARDSDFVEHDWHTIFSNLKLLPYDTLIGRTVRIVGWGGMIGIVIWFCWRTYNARLRVIPKCCMNEDFYSKQKPAGSPAGFSAYARPWRPSRRQTGGS
jgi:hypothetical protein